jgi:hypothetical protein
MTGIPRNFPRSLPFLLPNTLLQKESIKGMSLYDILEGESLSFSLLQTLLGSVGLWEAVPSPSANYAPTEVTTQLPKHILAPRPILWVPILQMTKRWSQNS